MASRVALVTQINRLRNPVAVPQSEPLNEKQVRNNAGGYVWKITDLDRFKRFLLLGNEKGTYYVSNNKLTRESIQCVWRLICDNQGLELVKLIKEYSLEGRVFKQEPLLFALAACCRCNDPVVKEFAYNAMGSVCRTPTMLFSFIEFCEALTEGGTGWGRMHRRFISNWYLTKKHRDLVYLVSKYPSRNGWSHTDVLRLAHVTPNNELTNAIFKWITKRTLPDNNEFVEEDQIDVVRYIHDLNSLKPDLPEEQLLALMQKHNLVREQLPTTSLNSVAVWKQLLTTMPMTALIRNLNKMTALELFNDSTQINLVVERLNNMELLRKARIHPINVLLALKTYASGKGDKGSLTWHPVQKIVDALDSTFYKSFKTVEATGKRFMLGIDVSGSMGSPCSGNVMCSEVAVALAMVTAATEKECHIMGFASQFRPLNISPRRRLDDNLKTTRNMTFGATDCALPMIHATEHKISVDVFIIYTDNETWFGKIHPAKALYEYRKAMNIPHAKLIVVALTNTNFSIADPDDAGMLDICGFDPNLPQIISSFVN